MHTPRYRDLQMLRQGYPKVLLRIRELSHRKNVRAYDHSFECSFDHSPLELILFEKHRVSYIRMLV